MESFFSCGTWLYILEVVCISLCARRSCTSFNDTPAILIEIVFISNANDVKAATAKHIAAIKAIVKVITDKEVATKKYKS